MVTFASKVSTPKAPAKNGNGDLSKVSTSKLVDEGGALDDLRKTFEDGPGKRLKEVKAELLVRAGNYPPEQPVALDGKVWSAELSKAPDTVTGVDAKAVHEMMGDAFYDVVSVPVKVLNDYLTKDQREQVITDVGHGTRRVKFKKAAG